MWKRDAFESLRNGCSKAFNWRFAHRNRDWSLARVQVFSASLAVCGGKCQYSDAPGQDAFA